ncbi:MAG TPA: hypothetical protein VMW62_03490 [Chloroflexota bacterium]|nr:hypothetical protein [Chloroflexota bacterium]
MTSTVSQRPVPGGPFLPENRPIAELSLLAMGFNIRRLGFYAWLVEHGKEPLVEDGQRIAIPRVRRSPAGEPPGSNECPEPTAIDHGAIPL